MVPELSPKKDRITEETSVALVRIANDHKNSFSARAPSATCRRTNLSEARILSDREAISAIPSVATAVMLHVVGLSIPPFNGLSTAA